MIVRRLTAHGFRNLERLHLELSPSVNLFVGRNGQGKTNLIESIYFLGMTRSFRTSRDEELIRFGDRLLYVAAAGETDEGVPFELENALERTGTKRLKRNGEVVRPFSRLIGFLGIVLFGPDEMELASGPPDVRRRFLDMTACQIDSGAVEILKSYRRTLAQKSTLLKRNAFLRRVSGREEGGLDTWDERLAAAGASVVRLRREVTEGLQAEARDLYRELGGGDAQLELQYRCSFGSEGEIEVEEALRQAVAARSEEERARGVALVGPHRDDLDIDLGNRPVRRFASQGQRRSVTISLKLAQARLIHRRREERPVVLLDDVFSELDGRRAHALWGLVTSDYQAFLTTPDERSLPGEAAAGRRFRVESGRIESIS